MTREILVVNDDSITAEGLVHLVDKLRSYGDVTVVAPKTCNSARSCAITMDAPLHLEHVMEREPEGNMGGLRVYTLDGTPVDCAKMGMNMFVEEGRMPDLLVSGINHGSNASAAVIYSGTLGAVQEAALYGITAIGLSIDTHDPHPDFAVVDEYLDRILTTILDNPPVEGTYLNINFPDIAPEQVRGIVLASQGRGRWQKELVKANDPRGREIYWMVGEFVNLAGGGDDALDDHILLKDGYITITPHKIDTTDYGELDRLPQLWDLDL